MASSGSSGRAASGYRSFDFGSDDVLCSYDDSSAQDPPMAKLADSSDLHETGVSRPLVSIYEQEDFSKECMMSTVEKCMKKYADNVLRSLEGISGRLSQLEIHCYKLERSLGEFRADFIQEQSDNDMKFKSLEKHIQEVHRSVQILRDKQELAETQKELAKLQLMQKESLEKNEIAVTRSVPEPTKLDDKPDTSNLQLALVLPRQVTTTAGASQPIQSFKELPMLQQISVNPSIQQDQIVMNQAGKYYPQHQSMPQDQRCQHVQSELHYVQQRSQLQDIPVQAPSQQPLLVNQNQPPAFQQYQQQLPPKPNQQLLQQVVQPQQPASQPQIRPQALPSYPSYPSQPVNPVPETFPRSMPMQVTNTTVSQPGAIRPEVMTYGYGGTGSSASRPPLHHNIQQTMQPPLSQSSFGQQLNKSNYMGNATYPPQPASYNVQGYSVSYSYPTSNPPASRNQQISPINTAALHRDSQLMRSHPFGEMIEKAVGMGYDRNQIFSCVQRMVESGQPVDFNSLLDRLNGQAAGASARAW
ncbi:pollen-specific leucine-rich repeat extensin-like protein 3 isoform X3 [Canna indica]|uniref:Pollen-specific leucine-rich repeat extensin-like protein 3 isoform X3 n=1 Tax=Canna indica TaxID=4628 RepID=A0AAQ3JL00_9LILI|nr:pollen-specific leucine-rich repeat extensin-like protein 3 isoform X3 [Canna indica]